MFKAWRAKRELKKQAKAHMMQQAKVSVAVNFLKTVGLSAVQIRKVGDDEYVLAQDGYWRKIGQQQMDLNNLSQPNPAPKKNVARSKRSSRRSA